MARAERAQRDFTALETQVAGLDAGEEGLDAEHEARQRRCSTTSRSGSPRPARRRSRPSATAPRSRPARRPSSSASTARTAPARCWPRPTRSPACSARSPRCSRCGRATRPPSPAPSARPPTPWPSRDADAAIDAIEHLKDDDLGRAGLLLGGAAAADDRRLARPARPRDVRRRRGRVPRRRCARRCARLLFKVAVVDDLDGGPAPGRRASRRHRGHPRGRPARRALRVGRLVERSRA